MKKLFWTPFFWALLFWGMALVAGSTAQAAGTPIRTLMTGSGGQLTVSKDMFVVRKRTRDLTSLDLGVGIRDQRAGRLSGVTLLVFREYLKPAELELLTANTNRVASTCFNISAERAEAMAYWLKQQNEKAVRNVSNKFGPLQLQFLRDISDDGTYYTAVYLSRSGIPGIDPWANWCTP